VRTLGTNTVIAGQWGRQGYGLQTFSYSVGFVGTLTLLVSFMACVTADARRLQ